MKNIKINKDPPFPGFKYILQKFTCLGDVVKFEQNGSYKEGIVTTLTLNKIVIFCSNEYKFYTVKWCNILENLSIN